MLMVNKKISDTVPSELHLNSIDIKKYVRDKTHIIKMLSHSDVLPPGFPIKVVPDPKGIVAPGQYIIKNENGECMECWM